MPGRRYSISGSDTNTGSTTQMGLVSTAAIEPALYDVLIGSVAAPNDNAWEFLLQRFTVAGTATAVTPQPLRGTTAATATAGVNHTGEPTYTANAVLLRIAGNQRAAYRWVAAPEGELYLPAVAANGVGLFSNAVGGSAVAYSYCIHFSE